MHKVGAVIFQIFLIGLNCASAFVAFFSFFCGMVGRPENVTSSCKFLMNFLYFPFLILEAVVFILLLRNIYMVIRSDPRALKWPGTTALVVAMLIPVIYMVGLN